MTTITSEALADYTPPAGILNNHVILVSGAGSGIGRAAAIALAEHGATVVLAGRTLAKLEATYDEIEENGYPQPAIFPINFESATAHDYEALKTTLDDTFGRLDGLLHCAGELGPRTPLEQYAESEWDKLMHVNLKSAFMLSKSLLPLLQKSANPRVLFTSSSVAKKGRAYWGAYAISKAGINNLTEVLADEMEAEESFCVNALNPGATRTPMRAAAYPAENPDCVTPPEQLMNRFIFLLSPGCKGVSGQIFDAQPMPC